jgi:hypothetical protein
MIWVQDYLRLRFAKGGRERPAVDCWGLYRLIVGERKGIWLSEFAGTTGDLAIARTLAFERQADWWASVASASEREADLVLMRGLVGEGRESVSAPLHVGYVTAPGKVLHIQDTDGVMHQAFRDGPTFRAFPTVRHRVLGIYRPKALA